MSAKLCFAENTIKSVFSAEHSFLGITDGKAPFRVPFPKWHFWNQKCHLGFSPVPAETPIFVVFGDFVWAQKRTIFQKQIIATKMRACLTFRTQMVFANFSKKCHFSKKDLWASQPPKEHYFSVCFFLFHFSSFLFCFIQHKKDKKQKCTFICEAPFLKLRQPAKKLFRTPTH